jgi:tRNA(Leu) C34 or U34 (ribose-2'-O)-methylase TrmL
MDILLYATENPRNLGSIIRTSVGFGRERLFLYDENGLLESGESVATISDVCRRGRENRIDVIPVGDVYDLMDSYSYKYATVLSPKSNMIGKDPDFSFEKDSLIIFGNESMGLPRPIARRQGVEKFVIPVVQHNDCFGLSAAYAMTLFEYLRQHPEEFPGMKD